MLRCDISAVRLAALHNRPIFHIYAQWEDGLRSLIMGFYTELFSRPRPADIGRVRVVRAIVDSVAGARRFETDGLPADFPRLVRSFSTR